MTESSLDEILNQTLERAVVLTTGRDDLAPRPGQVALAHDTLKSMLVREHSAGAAPTGVGKALDIDTPVPTPQGWTTMGEIRPGDVVFDETGAQCDVTWVSHVMTDRDCYEVMFSDGSSIVADGDHLWATATRSLRFEQAERRLMESDKGKDSLKRLRRVNDLMAIRQGVDHSGFLMTRREVMDRYPQAQDALLRARRSSDVRALNLGERFDIRPVLDEVIVSAEKSCGLLRPAPAQFEVMKTSQMMATLVVKDALNHAVPVAGPIDTKIADLPIDPYLFGAWLGDGTSSAGDVTSGAEDFEELMRNVQNTGYSIMVHGKENESLRLTFRQPRPDLCPYGHDDFVPNIGKRVNRMCLTCRKSRPPGGTEADRWNEPLTLHLRRLGVFGNKHIPDLYLRASIEQRVALLQGIMDTDGTASGRKCAIDLCNEALANDVRELILSLGFRVTFRKADATLTEMVDGERRMRVVGSRWRMSFSTSDPMFRFERKLAMQKRGKQVASSITGFRYVTDIRPVATRPVRCIQVSSANHLFLAGRTMIPTHNSLAYSIPAAMFSALRDERTVIATESINLQSQLVDKDLPVVAQAVRDVMGRSPKFALLKGWGNYVCVASAVAAASELTLQAPTTVAHALESISSIMASPESEVIKWSLEQAINDESGDRATMTLDATNEMWDTVSTTPAECPGVAQCQFGELCRPAQARALASEADIIVTNHAMLAMQAAIGVPVVITNKTIGPIHHLVIDEAHGLANTVRAQGASSVSAWRLFDVLRSLEHLHSGSPGKTKQLRIGGLEVMRDLDRYLASKLRGKTVAAIAPDAECLGDGIDDLVLGWLERARAVVPRPDSTIVLREIRDRYRALAKIDSLKNAITKMATDALNVARWIEVESRHSRQPTGLESLTGATLRLSPVDVAPLLLANLYDAQVAGEVGTEVPEDSFVMSVHALSATLPQSSVFDLGVSARREEYESPFSVAFANSALFVPKASPEDLAQLCTLENGKSKFNTSAHAGWAAKLINDLVESNEGSALVLAATTAAGKLYAESLRAAHPGLTVLSQWDGGSTRNIIKRWKDDIGSVLIGTRSLMTGVDASGNTNSLVVIDRVPRSAGNPVDDARVSKISERLEIDRWSADRFVYVADGSLLITQAAGRLIRSVSDSGLVAVLDPRLLKSAVNGLRYPEPTRQIYMSSFEKFGTKISDLKHALSWIAAHRARTTQLDVV